MKRSIKYLASKDVLLLHHLIIESLGGVHGISNYDLFESAVFSPHTTFVGQEMYPTIIEKAAALLHAFLNDPFFINQDEQQGAAVNPSTALLCCITFLELNGYHFNATPNEVVQFIHQAEIEKFNIDQIIFWIHSHCQKD